MQEVRGSSPRISTIIKMNITKNIFVGLGLFFFLHIVRDIMQIRYGYNHSWFTRFGHVWHAPQYEKQGIMVCLILGLMFFYLAFRHAA